MVKKKKTKTNKKKASMELIEIHSMMKLGGGGGIKVFLTAVPTESRFDRFHIEPTSAVGL